MKMRIDTNSLLATIFLAASAYVMLRAGQNSLYAGVLETAILLFIAAGVYFSYRLLAIINDVT